MLKASAGKKLSAAVLIATLGLAARSQGAVALPYSTGFEATPPDSAGQTYNTGNIVGQNGWIGISPGEDVNTGTVVSGTAASGSLSLETVTTGDGNYSDYFNSNLTFNPAAVGGLVNISFALDHAAPTVGQTTNTDPGSGAVRSAFGVDVLDTSGNIIASLFTIKSASGQDDLEVTNGGQTANTTVTGPAGIGRADGAFGTYHINLNFNNNTFQVFVEGNSAPSASFALTPGTGSIGGIAFAADGTGSNTAFFDNLSVVPEPIGATMVGIGTLALLLRRPKRLA